MRLTHPCSSKTTATNTPEDGSMLDLPPGPQDAGSSPPGEHYIFRLRDPILNLHLPLANWEKGDNPQMMSNYIEYIYRLNSYYFHLTTVLNFLFFGAILWETCFPPGWILAAVGTLWKKVGFSIVDRGSYRQTPRPACRKLELVLIDQLHTLDTKPTKVRTSGGSRNHPTRSVLKTLR